MSGVEDGNRSPPGTWRLLAPATLVWGSAAAAITAPGSGFWIACSAGTVGVALLGMVLLRRGGPRAGTRSAEAVHRAGRLLLVSCAALLVLGASIDAAERVRADPAAAALAESGRSAELAVVLRGFPNLTFFDELDDDGAVAGNGGARAGGRGPGDAERAWVNASLRTPRGDLPVVLWLSGDAAVAAAEARDWSPGKALIVHGSLVPLEPESQAAYGVGVNRAPKSFETASPSETRGVPRHAVSERAGSLVAELRIGLRTASSEIPGAALVPGFAVGDTSIVPARLEAHMLASSLTHVLAVSGSNCALVVSAAVAIVAGLGAGRRLRIIVASGALIGFVLVVGPDASVRRAAIMAAVMLLARFGGRRSVALPALAVAMLVLLLSDPWQALQPGFALSVAATAGIMLLVPEIERVLQLGFPVPRWIVLPFAVPLAAQLACGPLLLLLQPDISAVGVLANAIAGPAIPLGTGLGLIAMLLLPLSVHLGELVVALASYPARYVAATAEVSAALPFARWSWPGGWAGALLLAVAEAAVLIAWLLLIRELQLPGQRGSGRLPWRNSRTAPLGTRVLISVLLSTATGILVGPTIVEPLVTRTLVPSDWSVVACDVGQGDAILLRDPTLPEQVMLVDTGDDPELLAACLQRYGVRKIELLVLTHDDRDHVGALDSVIGRVESALVAPDSQEDHGDRAVIGKLRAAGIPLVAGYTGRNGLGGFGDVEPAGEVGARGGSGIRWEVLAPVASRVPADTNAASLVIRAAAGDLTVLLLGDTGEAEHAELLRRGSDLSATIVKVAHHGSRDQDPALAAAISAEYALVSVGAENRYGHPAAEALLAFEEAGTRPVRTDELGSIAISGAPGSLRVSAERGDEGGSGGDSVEKHAEATGDVGRPG